ncbi:hypothetical protein [Ruminococcus flavefaciens]|uniref:hypothetical protein n=1 Tax=Ruminococcus flavefaciens TaxID=1265 RepID=UPI0026EFF71E|nr:hypothetical protein [Ruminococcus flavefaciens]
MGKRIPMDQAMEAVAITPNDSIYAKTNKYGYKINVNHPQIQPLYEYYKRRIGEKILSDRQRLNFECLIFQMIERKNSRHE